MPITVSGWVVWNNGTLTSPDFIPKEIYPPALEIAEITETVYATRAEAQAEIDAHGGAHNYSAAGAAGGLGSGAVGPVGQAAQDTGGSIADIGRFFARLGQRDFIIRALKVVGGLAMIVVGIVQITGIAGKVKVLPI